MSDPVVHPHDLKAPIPDRVDNATLRALSRIDGARAARAIAEEWALIGVTIALAHTFFHPVVYVLAVVVIGARQHALTVIGHDAAHWRLFRRRWMNEWIGNVLVQWPVFLSVESFRKVHGAHHQFTAMEGDGNRRLWKTHTPDGRLTPEWRYPKTALGLVAKVVRRALFVTGAWWIVRSFIAAWIFRGSNRQLAARVAATIAVAALLTALHLWRDFFLFWVVPFCTWHIAAQYIRLITEHSAIDGDGPYAVTRTTLATPLERFFLVPRNIHYHLEHHWYPSVPWYNVPALHAALMEREGFRENACVTPSLFTSLRQCVAASQMASEAT